ncbi:MAG TPA: phenylalanine--tRNA ligase beta subunit-related protein [Bacilli bacterium]|jgi:DNA/RNA-binding domain of Phe-tRNA-synthetase-like protein|nr:hypothetical protein [Acholeplasmataceae bacterium]OQB64225.1 MAG: B3/4 domain protein [Tenericutes bacterium ADurb.Bin140]HOE77245.1 phenylalanine--tRNA ligase beta subunit-related protein [Bacilli bacterium]HON63589.1 phenylalanine--tRNA ligase beta subunit-related protein [Bacilli bacterium]HOR95667.1 phenylalanine--tRNA ligase beta subunit-related protein [Bacilli bacterium]
MQIILSDEIKTLLPNFSIIAYTMDVKNQKTEAVTGLLKETEQEYFNRYPLTDVVNIPKIKVARDGYKKCGKDPSRYRLATEALLRRVVKGVGLYRLGDLIDLGNILSIRSMRSICVVDYEKIQGNVRIRIGTPDDYFVAINRGVLNVDRMILYEDDAGPFGSPSSDTERTSITETTKKILIMMICFEDKEKDIDEALLLDLYHKYAGASNIRKIS